MRNTEIIDKSVEILTLRFALSIAYIKQSHVSNMLGWQQQKLVKKAISFPRK